MEKSTVISTQTTVCRFILCADDTVLFSVYDGNWKIGDFGLLTAATKNLRTTLKSRGTDCYRSPELLSKDHASFCNKSDIWALGCVVFEMITGRQRFLSDFAVYDFISQTVSDHQDQYFRLPLSFFLVSKLLEKKPQNRPSAPRYRRLINIMRFVVSSTSASQMAFPFHESLVFSAVHLSCLLGREDIEADLVREIMTGQTKMAQHDEIEAYVMALQYQRDNIAQALCPSGRYYYRDKALLCAASRGYFIAVQALLQVSARPNGRKDELDELGRSPLDIAIMRNNANIVGILFKGGLKDYLPSSKPMLRKLLAKEGISLGKTEAEKVLAAVLSDTQWVQQKSREFTFLPLSPDETSWSAVSAHRDDEWLT